MISTKIFFGGRGRRDTINSRGLSRKHLWEGLSSSLKRMQLSYVDLVFCHREPLSLLACANSTRDSRLTCDRTRPQDTDRRDRQGHDSLDQSRSGILLGNLGVVCPAAAGGHRRSGLFLVGYVDYRSYSVAWNGTMQWPIGWGWRGPSLTSASTACWSAGAPSSPVHMYSFGNLQMAQHPSQLTERGVGA